MRNCPAPRGGQDTMFLTPKRCFCLCLLQCMKSRNPLKSGQCFLQKWKLHVDICSDPVAIPSNRVNVSYADFVQGFLGEKTMSQSPQIGSMFLTLCIAIRSDGVVLRVAIPSNRVNVSYSTHLFLRIIGNLTPLFREPHYFYAFLFTI